MAFNHEILAGNVLRDDAWVKELPLQTQANLWYNTSKTVSVLFVIQHYAKELGLSIEDARERLINFYRRRISDSIDSVSKREFIDSFDPYKPKEMKPAGEHGPAFWDLSVYDLKGTGKPCRFDELTISDLHQPEHVYVFGIGPVYQMFRFMEIVPKDWPAWEQIQGAGVWFGPTSALPIIENLSQANASNSFMVAKSYIPPMVDQGAEAESSAQETSNQDKKESPRGKLVTAARNDEWRKQGQKLLFDPNSGVTTIKGAAIKIASEHNDAHKDDPKAPETVARELRGLKRPKKQ
ncbi:MAG: hypothetical protein HQM00_14335 [Magnetococcales bacterium]|nr:hypothetical protein [Magnetococcales bacterium]